MRPIYWDFYGLVEDVDGQNLVRYVAVLTPHFLERMVERGNRIGDNHFKALVPKFWEAAIQEKVCGTRLDNAYIYFRRKWNKKRRRRELEFISITPDRNFHTENNKGAIEVTLNE